VKSEGFSTLSIGSLKSLLENEEFEIREIDLFRAVMRSSLQQLLNSFG
jgi:hypothetical protein